MKKLAYIAFAILIGFSSCTKVEQDVQPGRKISFSAGSYAAKTKTGEETRSPFPTTKVFSSRAYLHAHGVDETQDFFGTGEQIYYIDATNTWEPGYTTHREYYWPFSDDSYINFVCWYDSSASPVTVSETVLSWTNRTVGASDEILYADEAWRYNDNANAVYYRVGVPVLFRQALSRLQFEGKILEGKDSTSSKLTKWEVYVTEMKVTNVHNEGSLRLTNEDPQSASTCVQWTVTGGNWTATDTASELVAIDNTSNPGGVQVSATASDLLAERSILPQAIDDMRLLVKWRIKTYHRNSTTADFSATPDSVEYLESSSVLTTAAVTAWAMGHKIKYTLVFDPSTDIITIIPSISNWDDADSASVTVQ